MKTALVAGATGLVGGDVLRLLLEDRMYGRVVALARRPLGIKDERLEERLIDFDRLDSADLFADHVYCALGTTMKQAGSREAFRKVDLDYVRVLAERSRAAGARAFALVSSAGANARSSNFYLRVKGEAEQAVIASGFESVQIMRPGFLVGERTERRTGEALGLRVFRIVEGAMVGPLRKYRPIRAVDVACAMIGTAAAETPGVKIYHYDEIWKLSRGGS
jgi:uncharacterized protein YbjT (DUF2867 family)